MQPTVTARVDRGTPELRLQRMARIGAVSAESTELWLSQGAAAAIAGTMPTKAERKRGAAEGVAPVRMIDTNETIDPIGRAWATGLLDIALWFGGYRINSAELRDQARRFAYLYWRKLPGASPISSLYAKMVSGLIEELPAGVDREQVLEDADARDARQEEALNRMLAGLRFLGHEVRIPVYDLVLYMSADAGPAWLDNLIRARTTGESYRGISNDLVTLRRAVRGLICIYGGGQLILND